MRTKLLILPTLAVVALSVGACGDDTGKRFADDVNKIQTVAANRINSSIATDTPDEVTKVASAQFQLAATKMAALKAPEGAADERDAIVNTLHAASITMSKQDTNPQGLLRYMSATAAQVAAEIKDANQAF